MSKKVKNKIKISWTLTKSKNSDFILYESLKRFFNENALMELIKSQELINETPAKQ